MTKEEVWNLILLERQKQDQKWGVIGFDNISEPVKLTILAEEFGEVGTAILNKDIDNLKTELIQCGALVVAWLEFLGVPIWR